MPRPLFARSPIVCQTYTTSLDDICCPEGQTSPAGHCPNRRSAMGLGGAVSCLNSLKRVGSSVGIPMSLL